MPWVTLFQVVHKLAPAPTPEPASSASPTPAPQIARGGPIQFSLSGSLSMGRSGETTTSGAGALPSASPGPANVQSSSQTTGNAGLLASVVRRTASTTLRVTLPAGVALRHSSLGALQAGFYGPDYGVLFGQQPLAYLGGVPLGSTLRGYGLVLPLRGGDLTFFDGDTLGAYDETARIQGVMARTVVGGNLLEFGLDRAKTTSGDRADAAIAGITRSSGLLTQNFEASVERLQTHGLASRAFGYQYRLDAGSNNFYTSVVLRRIGSGFLDFGSGLTQRDDLASLAVRDSFGTTSISADESLERTGVGSSLEAASRSDLAVGRTFNNGLTMQLGLTDARAISSFGTQWQGGASLQTAFGVRGVTMLLGADLQRTLASFEPATGTMTYEAAVQHQFGNLSAGYTFQSTRQSGYQTALQSSQQFTLSRLMGATAITGAFTSIHEATGLQNVVQTAPTISVTRLIGPVLSVAATFGEQITRNVTNPFESGRTRIFSLQLAAPFALGSGTVEGRVDPNLPASIVGRVLSDAATQQVGFGGNNGIGNVEVVLDDKTVERTTLDGSFQFNFVKPGEHQLRIEDASLPRGVTVDQPFISVDVLGGQQAQANFSIGNFGAIAGHVFGRDSSGEVFPIQGATLVINNRQIAKTDAFGAYGFGRLQPGKYTVRIDASSLPANAAFGSAGGSRNIEVVPGQITTLDFTAGALSSISGYVTFDQALGPTETGGVDNAYVVAEPGDYAVVTDSDGSYFLDNLPAGTYTLDIDPETLPPNTGNVSGSQSITIAGGQHQSNVNFVVGRKLKAVIFTFQQTHAPSVQIAVRDTVVPPLGATEAVVDASAGVRSVNVTAFGKVFQMHYDERAKRWTGMVDVPRDARGTVTLTAHAHGAGNGESSTRLRIDPRVPLAQYLITPRRYTVGEDVVVHARFLADVRAGDAIHWLDGQVTKLSHPVSGRVFAFTVKISEQPMRGFLLTQQGQLPIFLR